MSYIADYLLYGRSSSLTWLRGFFARCSFMLAPNRSLSIGNPLQVFRSFARVSFDPEGRFQTAGQAQDCRYEKNFLTKTGRVWYHWNRRIALSVKMIVALKFGPALSTYRTFFVVCHITHFRQNRSPIQGAFHYRVFSNWVFYTEYIHCARFPTTGFLSIGW